MIYRLLYTNIKKFVFCSSNIFKIDAISAYRSTKSGIINQENSQLQNKNIILKKQQPFNHENKRQQLVLK